MQGGESAVAVALDAVVEKLLERRAVVRGEPFALLAEGGAETPVGRGFIVVEFEAFHGAFQVVEAHVGCGGFGRRGGLGGLEHGIAGQRGLVGLAAATGEAQRSGEREE